MALTPWKHQHKRWKRLLPVYTFRNHFDSRHRMKITGLATCSPWEFDDWVEELEAASGNGGWDEVRLRSEVGDAPTIMPGDYWKLCCDDE